MIRTFLLGLCIAATQLPAMGQDKQVCVTVDDLPVVSYGHTDNFYQWDLTLTLIAHFDKMKIPAIGFVNEGKMYQDGVLDSTQLDLLKLWLQNGYEIGNHTYSHASYHRTSMRDFEQEILKGEQLSRHLELEYNKELVYFRHPYLHIGQTRERYDSLKAFLDSKGYIVAPVTIVNSDWEFASAYAKAERNKDRDTMEEIGAEYLAYTKHKLQQAEYWSQRLFDRDIAHTLLLHANRLNADYMDELGELFQSNGYKFVSLTSALKDRAYATEPTAFVDGGLSWLELWLLGNEGNEALKADTLEIPEWIKNYE